MRAVVALDSNLAALLVVMIKVALLDCDERPILGQPVSTY